MGPNARRGFTLTELMVAIAIIGVLAALAYDGMRRSRPRASFAGFATEVHSLMHQARQQALASGVPVVVMVFPNYVQTSSTGRIVVVQDDPNPAQSLLNAAAPLNLGNYDPATVPAPPNGQVVESLDLPSNVLVGPPTGLGRALLFPYSGIATAVACSFCAGANGRGAVVFDGRGRTTFYAAPGARLRGANNAELTGGSFTLYSTELDRSAGAPFSTSTLVITAPFGSLRTYPNG